jgi:hypothetical protein
MTQPKNDTDTWLRGREKTYLAEAAKTGRITYLTAFWSALDPRPLEQRRADLDTALSRPTPGSKEKS